MLSTLNSNINTEHSQDDAFMRHRGPITCACPVPNSTLVVTSGYDGAVALFNTKTSDVELLGYHAHLVNRVSVNSEGTLAASCSSDFNIYLWDLETNTHSLTLRGHSDDVEDFIFIDENYGASVARDWRVLLWNLKTGAIEHIFLGHAQDVLSIGHLDGKLYTSGDDMTLRIWDIAKKTLIKTLGPFDTEADTCTIDPINQRVILGCDDGLVRIFDINTGELTSSINAHSAGIKKVACSPINGDILSAAYDQRIIVWDAQSLELKTQLQHHSSTWERSFNWSTDGDRVYAGTFDGTVIKWNADNGDCIAEFGASPTDNGNACFNDVAIIDQQTIASVSDDGFVRTGHISADNASWQHIYQPKGKRILMNAITSQVSEIGGEAVTEIITGTHEQAIQRYQVNAGNLQQTLSVNLHRGPINCIRVAPKGEYKGQYFVACYTGSIARVDRDGNILDEINAHENAVKSLALHPSKNIGVSGSAEGVLASWDFDGNVLQTFAGHLAIIDDVAISQNGELVASAGRDFTLKIHRLSDGALIHNIGLGKRSPKALEFIGSDIVIVTNYWGELLRVDLNDESVICKRIAENGISGIAIKDQKVVASSYDGGLYLVDPETLTTTNSLHSMQQRVNNPAFSGY